MKKFLIVALLMGWASAAPATVRWHTAAIKGVYPQSDGAFALMFETSDSYCLNGDSPKRYTVAVGQHGVTQDGLKVLLAVALSAQATGKQILFAFDDTTAGCYINRFLTL